VNFVLEKTFLEKMEEMGWIENHHRKIQVPNLPQRVFIWDETLRDGEQMPGVVLTPEDKLEIAKMLDEIGVSIIAIGMPFVSAGDKRAIQLVVEEGLKNAKIAVPARALLSDVKMAVDVGAEEIPIFLATSKLRLEKDYRKNLDLLVDKFLIPSIEYAKDHGVIVDFVTEDATRSKLDMLVDVYKRAIEAGADKIVIADTVGFARPDVIKLIVRYVKNKLGNNERISYAIHCHNDFGLAVANTLAAVEEGVEYPHVTVNGYGERSGNAALEEVVMALEILYGVKTGIKLDKLYELSKFVEKKFLIPLQRHKPIVGENSFAHESGIHVHAILSNPLSYEPFPPSLIGRKRKIYIGKHSGKKSLAYFLIKTLQAIDNKEGSLYIKVGKKEIILNEEKLADVLQAMKTDLEMKTIELKNEYESNFIEILNKLKKLRFNINEKDVIKHLTKFEK